MSIGKNSSWTLKTPESGNLQYHVEAKGGTSAAEHRQETCQAVTPKGCTPQALAVMSILQMYSWQWEGVLNLGLGGEWGDSATNVGGYSQEPSEKGTGQTSYICSHCTLAYQSTSIFVSKTGRCALSMSNILSSSTSYAHHLLCLFFLRVTEHRVTVPIVQTAPHDFVLVCPELTYWWVFSVIS